MSVKQNKGTNKARKNPTEEGTKTVHLPAVLVGDEIFACQRSHNHRSAILGQGRRGARKASYLDGKIDP